MNQIIYSHIYHKRYRPKENTFSYKGFQIFFNIDDIYNLPGIALNRWSLFSINAVDHAYRSKVSKEEVSRVYRNWAQEKLSKANIKIDGDIYLQTIPRVLGYVFNPVSFWFCFNGYGEEKRLKAVICEVNNTFGESHNYIIDIDSRDSYTLPKSFHVSPFYPRTGSYEFSFKENISIKYFSDDHINAKTLDLIASITPYAKKELTSSNMLKAFLKIPFFTMRVMFLIHWQALRLFIKKIQFFNKPEAFPQEDTYGSNR